MNRNRWLLLVALLVILIGAAVVLTRQPANEQHTVAIINLGSHPILDASVTGIKQALAEEGFGAEQLRIIDLSANMDMNALGALAREAIAAHPDVIVPISTPVTQAIVTAPRSPEQRVVFSTVTNPADVGADTVGNMTGVSDAVNYEANLDLIVKLFPNTRTIGMAYNPGEPNSQYGVDQVRNLARQRGLELITVPVSSSGDVQDAVASLTERANVIYVGSDNTVVSAMAAVTSVAYDRRIPVVASDVGSVEEGALAAVSVDYNALGQASGRIVARLLRSGDRASSIPKERFLGNSLVLNDGAAQRLGYTFSDSIRGAATRIVAPK